MLVSVTGGTGFVGSHSVAATVRWLRDSGLLTARQAGRLGSTAVGTAP